MTVAVTGATGMVGKGVLLECLDHRDIEKVYAIGRNSTGITHPKLEELIHTDFTDFSSIADQLKTCDAVYACMGVSSAGMDEAKYTHLTYDFTMALAQEALTQNSNMTFTYVSGEGTDSSEQGRTMWARVKGRTENALLNAGFKQAYMFRPGAIIPLRGIKSKTKLYQFMYDYFMWLLKLLKVLSPKSIVDTTQIGLAMIAVTRTGYDKGILRPADIQKASDS